VRPDGDHRQVRRYSHVVSDLGQDRSDHLTRLADRGQNLRWQVEPVGQTGRPGPRAYVIELSGRRIRGFGSSRARRSRINHCQAPRWVTVRHKHASALFHRSGTLIGSAGHAPLSISCS
jgi:hypothetical protein